MLIVHVFIQVKPEHINGFIAATQENCRNSIKEPGVVRFDCIQQQDGPAQFVLIEIYRSPQAAVAHKETAHYALWRDTVADMMAVPRSSIKYTAIFPDNET